MGQNDAPNFKVNYNNCFNCMWFCWSSDKCGKHCFTIEMPSNSVCDDWEAD